MPKAQKEEMMKNYRKVLRHLCRSNSNDILSYIISMYKIFKKLLGPLWSQKKYLPILVVRGVFFGMFASIVNIAYKYGVDSLVEGDMETFIWSAGIIATFFVCKSVPWHFFRKTQFIFYTELQRSIYQKYLWLYLLLDTNEVERIWTWRMNSIIQKWWDNRMEIIKEIPQNRTDVVMTIVIGLWTVYWSLDRKAWLATTVAVWVMILIGLYWNKKVAKFREEKRDAYISADRKTVKMIMSKMEIIQSWNANKELEKISDEFDIIRNARVKESKGFIWWFDIPRWTMDVIRISLYVYIWYWVVAWWYSLGDLVLVWWLMKLIELSIRSINDRITDFMRRIIFVEKLWDTFENTPMIQWYEEWREFTYGEWLIQLSTISYGYDDQTDVFDWFSLTLQWWKKTALVWSSGSGKSTLVKLIAWYLRPDSGAVIVDGQDLTEVSLKSYYKHIGYLTQEPSVFDGTIRENLLYAVEDNSNTMSMNSPVRGNDEQWENDWSSKDPLLRSGWSESDLLETRLHQAIKQANCEFIYDLPQWLDTEIWERWIRLSGWQRQRLAIAKIFLKNPEIIILDEPTSALDSFSEEAITQAMHALFENRTVIIIAHRLQTVKHADDIILLEWGSVVERGTHDELVNQWGQYAKMLELQSWF